MKKIFNILGNIAKTKIMVASAVAVTSVAAVGATYVAVNSKPIEETKEEIVETHEHSYIEKETKNATCTESGYIIYGCECGDEYTKELPQTDHVPGSWEIAKEPTKKENGLRQKKCTVCGEIIQTEPIRINVEEEAKTQEPSVDALENVDVEKYKIDENGNVSDINIEEAVEIVPVIHEHNYEKEVIQKPSCIKSGTNKYTCQCGASYIELVDKLSHETETKTVEGNCTTSTVEEEICKNCNQVLSKKVIKMATGHNYKDTDKKEATCLEEGKVTHICKVCGYEEKETVPALGHDYQLIEEKNATCTSDGYELYRCNICKKEITKNYKKASGHNYEVTETKEADKEDGYTLYTCTNCNDSYKETIPTSNHDYEVTQREEATCEENGKITYTCKTHGETYEEIIPALTHNYEIKESKDATCTSNGYITYVCSNCKKTYTEEIPVLKHEYEETITKEATCTESGLKTFTCKNCNDSYTEDIQALGHDYTENEVVATCTSLGYTEFTCSRCGDYYTDFLDMKYHDYSVIEEKKATCTESGYTKYECVDCGDSYIENIPALGHDYTKTVVEPTCENEGYTLYECANDSTHNTRTNYVNALGHTAGEFELTKKATCDESGLEQKLCTVCGEVVEEKVVPALGHNYKVTEEKAPTCEEEGYILETCENCDNELRQTIPALSHNWEKKEVINPTCEESGYTLYVCANDTTHTKKDDETQALGHEEGDWIVIKDATCTETGLEEKYCKTCNKLLTSRTIPAKNHTYEVSSAKKATCAEDGENVYTCTICGDSYSESIPHLDHDYILSSIKDATCTENGENVYTCTICGDSYSETISTSGHNYELSSSKDATCVEAGYDEYTCTKCGDSYEEAKDVISHDYSVIGDNGHVKTYVCNMCGDSYNEVYGDEHNFVEVDKVDPTCNADGMIYYECSDCKETYEEVLPKIVHTLTTEVTIKPTCSSEGESVTKCVNCGEIIETNIIPKTEHTLTTEVTTNPTCTNNGEKQTRCTICGEVINTESIMALEHKYEVKNVKVPTCNEDGSIDYECILCGDTYSEPTQKLEHNYILVETVHPTCSEVGSKNYKCEYCDDSYSEEIPMVNHNYTTTIKAGTCVEKETTIYTCDVCGESHEEITGDYGNHLFKQTLYQTATCTSDGKSIQTCEYCHEEKVENFPAVEHNYEKSDSKNATCTEMGYTKYTCKNCNDSYTENIPAKGHVGGIWQTVKQATNTQTGLRRQYCIRCNELLAEDVIEMLANNDKEYTIDLGNGNTTTVWGHYESDYATQIIELLNDYREENGLKRLEVVTSLNNGAAIRAYEIVNTWGHTRPNGQKCYSVASVSAGENIAKYYASPEDVMTGWKNSSGHNANMLRDNFTKIGVSVFAERMESASGVYYYRYYFVQLFGR